MLSQYTQEPSRLNMEGLPDICEDARPRPDNNPNDAKYVPWSPAFKKARAGVRSGNRMMTKGGPRDGGTPYEFVLVTQDWPQQYETKARDNKERPAVVFNPRRGTTERYSLEEIEDKFIPYEYDSSCEFEGRCRGQLETPRSYGKEVSESWRQQVDHLLLKEVMDDRSLLKKLGKISLAEDGGTIHE